MPVRKVVLVSQGCSRLLDGFCAGSITASKGVGGLVAEITWAKIAFIPRRGFWAGVLFFGGPAHPSTPPSLLLGSFEMEENGQEPAIWLFSGSSHPSQGGLVRERWCHAGTPRVGCCVMLLSAAFPPKRSLPRPLICSDTAVLTCAPPWGRDTAFLCLALNPARLWCVETSHCSLLRLPPTLVQTH